MQLVGNLGEKEVKRFRMKVLANTNQGRRREQNEDIEEERLRVSLQ